MYYIYIYVLYIYYVLLRTERSLNFRTLNTKSIHRVSFQFIVSNNITFQIFSTTSINGK